ncbi:MAG: class I SAM-dependent methyltransferase [Pseudomonadota bacterium]
MTSVKDQYEAYPYPARDPAEEATRLIAGSPSDPVEVDHYLFQGKRDWRQPFRVLVAGGGTGDGLILLAQRLRDIGCPAEITYIDLSNASREIAEARAAARGLDGIRWITGDLLQAPALGPFDYIDCCGVLHHLPDPDAGFQALAQALDPSGGMGVMVYAPLGRSGVYPLQEAFGRLLGADAPEQKVRLARQALEKLAPTHPFARNALVGDHKTGNAGLYDLLLHSQDRPYAVGDLVEALGRADLGLVSFVERARYDPLHYLPRDPAFRLRTEALEPVARAGLAEQLSGNMKTHIAYVAHSAHASEAEARPTGPAAVPHLRGVVPLALAKQVREKSGFSLKAEGLEYRVTLPRGAAPLIGGIDGVRTLGEIAEQAGLDWIVFLQHWGAVSQALTGFNLLHYSQGARR